MKEIFYDHIRKFKLFGPTFSKEELEGTEAILNSCEKWPTAWTAYALATAYHETAGTMQPIKEYGGTSYYMKKYDISGQDPDRARKMGNTKVGDGAKYCGRGLVQLTWKNNYIKAGKELGKDLENNPDLAMQDDIAALIMVKGMKAGWFTGKKLSDYLALDKPGTKPYFTFCRRIINGNDKADVIASYALDFQTALLL